MPDTLPTGGRTGIWGILSAPHGFLLTLQLPSWLDEAGPWRSSFLSTGKCPSLGLALPTPRFPGTGLQLKLSGRFNPRVTELPSEGSEPVFLWRGSASSPPGKEGGPGRSSAEGVGGPALRLRALPCPGLWVWLGGSSKNSSTFCTGPSPAPLSVTNLQSLLRQTQSPPSPRSHLQLGNPLPNAGPARRNTQNEAEAREASPDCPFREPREGLWGEWLGLGTHGAVPRGSSVTPRGAKVSGDPAAECLGGDLEAGFLPPHLRTCSSLWCLDLFAPILPHLLGPTLPGSRPRLPEACSKLPILKLPFHSTAY